MYDLKTIDLSTVSLAEYLAMINSNSAEWMAAGLNRWSSGLTSDLSHWAEYGITTAEGLGQYLDDCCEREAQKTWYGHDDAEDAQRAPEMEVLPEPHNHFVPKHLTDGGD